MPELPEVETVARQLAPLVEGRTVAGVRLLDPRLRNGPLPRLTGRRVERVGRLGKQVMFVLSPRPGERNGGGLWLLVHLRMTGRLHWVERLRRGEGAHLRARFRLDRGELLFVDTRRFGTFSWYRSREEAEPVGIDPLSSAFTPRRLAELVAGSRQALKPFLLRQDKLVGLGNIYASEIPWVAGLSPFRRVGRLKPDELRRLCRATRRVLRRAIDNCGTTFSDFQDARGVEGSYQRFLAVYDRAGERCRRCGARVRRRVQQQRSTFWCPGCQR